MYKRQVIYINKNRPESVARVFRERQQSEDKVGISLITYFELLYGIEKSNQKKRGQSVLGKFLNGVDVLELGQSVGNCYAAIRASLEILGKPIGSMDLLIAAHAMDLGATLVTHNIKEFGRVEKLSVVDWVSY